MQRWQWGHQAGSDGNLSPAMSGGYGVLDCWKLPTIGVPLTRTAWAFPDAVQEIWGDTSEERNRGAVQHVSSWSVPVAFDGIADTNVLQPLCGDGAKQLLLSLAVPVGRCDEASRIHLFSGPRHEAAPHGGCRLDKASQEHGDGS
jgi:hypothetical protein